MARAAVSGFLSCTAGRILSRALSLSKPALSTAEGDRPKVVSKPVLSPVEGGQSGANGLAADPASGLDLTRHKPPSALGNGLPPRRRLVVSHGQGQVDPVAVCLYLC